MRRLLITTTATHSKPTSKMTPPSIPPSAGAPTAAPAAMLAVAAIDDVVPATAIVVPLIAVVVMLPFLALVDAEAVPEPDALVFVPVPALPVLLALLAVIVFMSEDMLWAAVRVAARARRRVVGFILALGRRPLIERMIVFEV
jgi:hypothetical protein